MSELLKLPVGIDLFEKLRRNGFYYVDKTELIEQLLNTWGEVNLFTRPRRFGKTLNMSMLRSFFEIGTDPSLFDGLYISGNGKLCEEHMGKYPVVFISLKSVEGFTYDDAKYWLADVIGREARRFCFLSESANLNEEDKNTYRAITSMRDGRYVMDDAVLISSLRVLSELLYKHYSQKTVILIDEYDVPLDKAFRNGYYREMVSLIRNLFGQSLKTNNFLQFAVLTGCLRVSKESIFTGLNNFNVMSITDTDFDEQFGFTEAEVKELLAFYHLESHLPEIKEWYDGYRFGGAHVYCPWDVVNHVSRLSRNPNVRPQAYWINSSGNDLVKCIIYKADQHAKNELEHLVAGDSIEKRIRQDLTYDEIDNSIDHIWSVLFTTGYLTLAGAPQDSIDGDIYKLKIPNKEVQKVYEYQITEWFNGTVLKSMDWLPGFWRAFEEGNAKEIENRLTVALSKTISVFDIKKTEPENSYHTFLLGMLAGNAVWGLESNREGGDGRPDIVIMPEDPDAGIIIELKRADSVSGLDAKCREALEQIRDRRYAEYLINDGRDNILYYGIAFYRKRCRVVAEKMKQSELRGRII